MIYRLFMAIVLCSSLIGIAQETPIPFAQADTPPVYKDCSSASDEESTQCTISAIENFAKKKFNTGLFKHLNLNEKRVRVYAQFTITKNGAISSISARTAHPQLEKETKRVLSLVPRFIPGKHEGNVVETLYTLPLVFTLG